MPASGSGSNRRRRRRRDSETLAASPPAEKPETSAKLGTIHMPISQGAAEVVDTLDAQRRKIEQDERARVRKELDEARGDDTIDDGRRERSRIPIVSFWHVLEQRVKNGKLVTVHGLSEQTRRNSRLKFVGRTRVGALVEWIDANPEQARLAYELHDIPAGFRATDDGVLVPRNR